MATNFFELATTLKNSGATWLSEKKNFTPSKYVTKFESSAFKKKARHTDRQLHSGEDK